MCTSPGVTSPNNYRRVFLLRFMRFSPYWKDSQLMRSSWKNRHVLMQCINNGSYVGNDYDTLGLMFPILANKWTSWKAKRNPLNPLVQYLKVIIIIVIIMHNTCTFIKMYVGMLSVKHWLCTKKTCSNIWTWVSMDSGLPNIKTNPKIPSNT